MSKKRDPKYDTSMEKNKFLWGLVLTDTTIGNLFKKRAGKGSGFDQRYVVIFHNYIVYYKPETKEGLPRKYDFPKGVVNLRSVNHEGVVIDPDNSSLRVPTSARVFEFVSNEDDVLKKWLRVVRERAEAISKVRVEELVDFPVAIRTVQEIFPKSFSILGRVRIENFAKFTEDRRKYATELRKWEPYVRNASLFYECYFGENRHYLDWFVGADGPAGVLHSSDEECLATWKAEVDKALKAAQEIAEIRFFKEDLEETSMQCDKAIECIEGINKYSKEFLNKDNSYTEQFTKEREILTKFAASFRAFPSVRTIDFRTHRGGRVVGYSGDEFEFTLVAGVVAFKGKSGTTPVDFVAQGPEISSRNERHGTVVWNGRIWVWYHTRYPHTVRFDFDPKTGVFRYRPSPSASGAKGETPAYADWALEKGGGLKCLGGAGKQAPSCAMWKIEGDVPVCAALLGGLLEVLIAHSNSV